MAAGEAIQVVLESASVTASQADAIQAVLEVVPKAPSPVEAIQAVLESASVATSQAEAIQSVLESASVAASQAEAIQAVLESASVPASPAVALHAVLEVAPTPVRTEAFDVDDFLPLLYHQLKLQARRALRGERFAHTLSPTALVHEAYVRLSELHQISWRDRSHFLGAAAQVMRRVLISYARAHNAEKRGGPHACRTEIEDVIAFARNRPDELLELDAALDRLAALSERQAHVVECRFFAEMSLEETAEVLQISPATVKREWTMARAWLNRELLG